MRSSSLSCYVQISMLLLCSCPNCATSRASAPPGPTMNSNALLVSLPDSESRIQTRFTHLTFYIQLIPNLAVCSSLLKHFPDHYQSQCQWSRVACWNCTIFYSWSMIFSPQSLFVFAISKKTY